MPLDAITGLLQRVALDAAEGLERVRVAEGRWNRGRGGAASASMPAPGSLEALVAEHKGLHKEYARLSAAASAAQGALFSASSTLEDLLTEGEEVAEALLERGEVMTSASRVQQIRAALVTLQKENEAMHVRIGVLQHDLIRRQYAQAARERAEAAGEGSGGGGGSRRGAGGGPSKDDEEEGADE
jgi:hypothetical protein